MRLNSHGIVSLFLTNKSAICFASSSDIKALPEASVERLQPTAVSRRTTFMPTAAGMDS